MLTASNVLFPLVTYPYVSRILQATATGKVNYASTFINYFVMVASLGIPTYGIRICSGIRDDSKKLSKAVHELLIINSVMTIISFIFLIMILVNVSRFYTDLSLYAIGSINLLLNMLGMNWLYSALEDYKYITIRSIIFKVVSLLLIILLIHSPGDYIKYMAIEVFAVSGSNILNFFHSRKYVQYKKFENYEIRKHIKAVLTFFATTLAISIYTNLDIIMLGSLVGDTQVGYYSSALKIRSAAGAFITVLSTILLPRLSYYAANQKQNEFIVLIKKSLVFAMITTFSLTTFFMLCATPSILLLSGPSFFNAGKVLFYLMPSVLFAGISNVTGTQLLVPYGRENALLISIISGAAVDFILNLFLIPRYCAVGAAISTSIAELLVLLIQILISRKNISELLKGNGVYKVVFALGLSSCILIITKNFVIGSNLVYLALNAGLFFGSYIIFLYIFKVPLVINMVFYAKGMYNKLRRI